MTMVNGNPVYSNSTRYPIRLSLYLESYNNYYYDTSQLSVVFGSLSAAYVVNSYICISYHALINFWLIFSTIISIIIYIIATGICMLYIIIITIDVS